MIPGIYPPDVRSAAESTATVNRGTNFAVSFTFLTLVRALTRSGAFCLYASIGLLTITFTLARMPDRRGRSLQQIQRQLGVPLHRGERPAGGCDAALNRRQCGPQDAGRTFGLARWAPRWLGHRRQALRNPIPPAETRQRSTYLGTSG